MEYRRLVILFALCFTLFLNTFAESEDKVEQYFGKKCDEYYDNAKEVKLEFPHMASIGYGEESKKKWYCGGSLISEKHVLTTAVCLTNGRVGAPKLVRLGATNFKTADSSQIQEIEVGSHLPHPDYQPKFTYNDIGIIVLKNNVVVNEYVRPICLEKVNELKGIIATGWGVSGTRGSELNSDLKKIQLNHVPKDKCEKIYNNKYKALPDGIKDESQICAATKVEGLDTCQGDAGAPVQIKNSKYVKAHIQVGITSFGSVCGNVSVPSVYTRVSYYLPWIHGVVSGN